MTEITVFNDITKHIENERMVLLYLSRPGCGVCTALKPKILSLIEDFPGLNAYSLNLDDMPEAGGQLSIFTLPGVLVYTDGKESIREARYISIDLLEERLRRLYSILFPGA